MPSPEAMTAAAKTVLSARQTCPSGYYYYGGCVSSWDYWGRWVVVAAIIVIILILLVLMGCVNARRRRRRGMMPMYGTGWMAGGVKPQGQYPPPEGYQYAPPPPQYTPGAQPQYTGTTFNTGDGYYGQQNNDIPLQQPQQSHWRGGEHGYEPPPGPPPNKAY